MLPKLQQNSKIFYIIFSMTTLRNSACLAALEGNFSRRNICRKHDSTCITTSYLPFARTIVAYAHSSSCTYSEPIYNEAYADCTLLLANKKSMHPQSYSVRYTTRSTITSTKYSVLLPSLHQKSSARSDKKTFLMTSGQSSRH